ncbi:hypothetical protein LCGC14_0641130 [marine sediment metagenome]|uniref:Solute-binding protein family 5 domain-containing protein n=1 Tax=marine sediment metagenome TaxID=412755 RepID=A0A0F9QZ31_9ZZZZ|nr:hypothetical protein [bacterium]
MKKLTTMLPFILLVSSIAIPIIPAIAAPPEEAPIIFTVGSEALVGNWDAPITDWYNMIYGSYAVYALEYLVGKNAGYGGGVDKPLVEEWVPVLATNWTVEYYDIEENSEGWNATGGIQSITLTLREGVKFHDNSDFNATVAKWNIDRWYIICGNLSGIEDDPDDPTDYANHGNWLLWPQTNTQVPYFTSYYNLSEYDAPDILGPLPPSVPPGLGDYPGYFVGPNISYPGVNIDSEGYVYHPNPWGGWDWDVQGPIHNQPYDTYPIVKWVEIIDDKQSGGTIKVHYNSWNTGGLSGGVEDVGMLSYDAYSKNYTSQGIYGYENDFQHADNPTLVDHMIGTGPYTFEEHDETGTPPGGYMLKNENYWNKTALEDDGWFDVERRQIIKFPAGQLAKSVRDTALLTHEIDSAWDAMYMPIDLDGVMAAPNIAYYPKAPSQYLTYIVLNSINETWWSWPWGIDVYKGMWSDQGEPGGIPRKMREAISYAFDYDNMINQALDGRAVRGGSIVGIDNIYYNASNTVPVYNLTRAREILLTAETDSYVFNLSTPIPHEPLYYNKGSAFWGNRGKYLPNPDLYNFSKMTAERGLTASSTDGDWKEVAAQDPILVIDFWWDSAHEDVKNVLLTSLENIGVALLDPNGATNRVQTIVWDYVRAGHLTNFPGTDPARSLWSVNAWAMDFDRPPTEPELNLFWAYSDPDRGRWRTEGTTGIRSLHYWGNFGFSFDDDVYKWQDRLWMISPSERKYWISKIAEKEATQNFPELWLYQAKEGYVLWKDWTPLLATDPLGNAVGYWGEGFSTHLLRYTPENLVQELPISASPILITLVGSLVSMLGIIYAIMRKRKLR